MIIAIASHTDIAIADWRAAGYRTLQVDPRAPPPGLPLTLDQALPLPKPTFLALFPPCTDLAYSGARWWKAKSLSDPLFQARALALAASFLTYAKSTGAPYYLENPHGLLSQLLGPADHVFHPWHYSQYAPDEHYTKETHLWVGGGFVMPEPQPLPGKPSTTAVLNRSAITRSRTPAGFARAVFLANYRQVPL